MEDRNEPRGLYRQSFEHDACGIGFVAHVKGRKSHQMISDALTILENLDHRGACGAEPNTGDGAGLMIQIPHEFLFDECLRTGFSLPASGDYGVGMLFLPKEIRAREECREIIYRKAEKLGLEILGFRKVSVNPAGVGHTALSVEPEIEQFFVARPYHVALGADFERKLFVLKTYITKTVYHSVTGSKHDFYIVSLSSRTIIYKGQLTSLQVRSYFDELNDQRMVSAFGLVHSRFATNTFPSWRLAQPFRFIAHNGEINTLQGNLNWFRSSVKSFASPYFTPEELQMILPVIDETQSDSGCLDNVVELLLHAGRSLPHVLMMLIPEAWDGNEEMNPQKRAFYEFHASLMEPWDGPAAIAFTDGALIGATLDRNGLRPSRYVLTRDDRVIMASESGALAIDQSTVIKKGRLTPGKMFVVDMDQGRIISDQEIKDQVCGRRPYADWINQYQIRLEELPEPRVMFTHLSDESVFKYQQVFGYTREDIELLLKPMAIEAKEAIGSMGTDTPLAILSKQPQHLSAYFKQLFAQVTNPPIDPIREKVVMSLAGFMGNNGNLLEENQMQCHCVGIKHPILTNLELEKLRSIDTGLFQSKTLQTYFRANGQAGALAKALDRLCRYAVDAVEDGFQVIVLSDRAIDSTHAAIPSLLAVSSVHHHLIRKGYRGAVGLVVEAGDVWEVHHFATLIGFGATAVNPYLALETIRRFNQESNLTVEQLTANYIYAVNNGLLKIFSKMGISTLQSYHGAQIFEILGIHEDVVNTHFTGAVSRIGGLGLDEIARETLIKHRRSFGSRSQGAPNLTAGGTYKWRRRGEKHLFNPETIHLLQLATRKNDYETFRRYSKLINEQTSQAYTIRGLFQLNYHHQPPVPLDEVESAQTILKRFATGAMSFGSISHEAHSTLAIAMNRIGGKSNTGEGGEDELRYQPLDNGDSMRSAIKQIASARFGVTSHYLTNADELQIKMAQGAKPGEGGQLPGHKVDEWIAKVRHSTPGVGLISPPPHHDIYSIEDLAQLIFDLKNANRTARINVKLVSKAGVGTIAAGVAKAHADVILVSGYDGGTGASPLTSIQHAGLPWELGLAEAHQTLVMNRLRSRVVLQTDGQLKTGRDIAIAALLGAEEWGVATAALVTSGCIMMRKCHLNTCPVGVATQDPDLRKLFTGDPDHVVNLFHFLAEELREIMAELGFRTVNEMIGQTHMLQMRPIEEDDWKLKHVDLHPVLYKAAGEETLYNTQEQNHGLEQVLDHRLIESSWPAILHNEPVFETVEVKNTDRSIGTMLSNEISKQHKSIGLAPDTINIKCMGSAGQSFGAFAAKGLSLTLEGEGNDYVGKGLSGAKIVVYPFSAITYRPEHNILIGNVALYGATSGELYVRGKAGERFAVRNSGATAVVEGIGDHGAEYMTGGELLILGDTGTNFAAGMSGGIAWIYDVSKTFAKKCNLEMVDLDPLLPEDEARIQGLLKNHLRLTKSQVAAFILNDWDHQLSHFVKVFPKEYKAVLSQHQQVNTK